MTQNIFFNEEELEILGRLLVLSVREVVVADGEANLIEWNPLTSSINNPEFFPISVVGEVLQFMKEKGPDYGPNIIKEINEKIDTNIFYEITNYAGRVLENLHKRDRDDFLAGLYGLLLETVHADGHKDEEESAAALSIMRSITDLSMKDVIKMNKTWRKKAKRFGY